MTGKPTHRSLKKITQSLLCKLTAEEFRDRAHRLAATQEDMADDKASKVYRYRLDTGEVIHERVMSDEERQVALKI